MSGCYGRRVCSFDEEQAHVEGIPVVPMPLPATNGKPLASAKSETISDVEFKARLLAAVEKLPASAKSGTISDAEFKARLLAAVEKYPGGRNIEDTRERYARYGIVLQIISTIAWLLAFFLVVLGPSGPSIGFLVATLVGIIVVATVGYLLVIKDQLPERSDLDFGDQMVKGQLPERSDLDFGGQMV